MAVDNSFTLPDQPLVSVFGTSTYVALGGDGLSSPRGAYSIRSARITGDASGGLAAINVTMDNRFTSLIQYVTGQVDEVAAATDFKWVITSDSQASAIDIGSDVNRDTDFFANAGHTWMPPAILLPGNENSRLIMEWPNVLNDTFFLDTLIFLFDIDVRQKAPIAPLLWARGAVST